MPKKKALKIPRTKLKIERKADGTEFILVDWMICAYQRFEQSKVCNLCLVSAMVDQLPTDGHILPFISDTFQAGLLLEMEHRARKGLPLDDVQTPRLPFLMPAIHIHIDAKVKGGDFEKGGKVSITCGVLHNFPFCLNYLREDVKEALEKSAEIPKFPNGRWENWCSLDEQWAHDLWAWTGAGLTAPKDWIKHSDISGELFASKMKSFNVVTERDEKALMLATICLLFNYWERKKLPIEHRVFHLQALGFGLKITKGSLSNWMAEAGCIPKSRSLILRQYQTVRNNACRYFERNPDEFHALMKSAKMHSEIYLKPRLLGSD